MSEKIFCRCLCALLFALCPSAEAQQAKKVPRIGYLSPTDPASDSTRSEAIRLALRELGYVEGQNIDSEYRYAQGKRDLAPELAADLVRLKVDIIVAVGGDTVVRAAMNATKTIPIVMMGQGIDPVEAGFVENLARPGGNVTGFTNLSRELGGKRLDLLKEAVPKVAPCRGSLRSSSSGQCARGERRSPGGGACAGIDYPAWGGTRCGRF